MHVKYVKCEFADLLVTHYKKSIVRLQFKSSSGIVFASWPNYLVWNKIMVGLQAISGVILFKNYSSYILWFHCWFIHQSHQHSFTHAVILCMLVLWFPLFLHSLVLFSSLDLSLTLSLSFSPSPSISLFFLCLICNDYVIRAARQKGGATIISALD